MADLETLFSGLSPGGLPGFREFIDDVHWRPHYNKAVWEEIFRSAASCGIKGFERFKVADGSIWDEAPRKEAIARLHYGLSWLANYSLSPDGNGLNEGVLAEFSYIREEFPAVLAEAAASPEKLDKMIVRTFWASSMVAWLKTGFPVFLAHVAETERRLGNYSAALALCERALSLAPGDGRIRLVRAQSLAALGRGKEAEKEFLASNVRSKGVAALMLAYGYSLPTTAARPAQNNAAAPAQNTAAAPAQQPAAAPKLSQQERLAALMALCVSTNSAKNMEPALRACQSVVCLVNSGTEVKSGDRKALGSDASFQSYKFLKALGRFEEARETLRWTVQGAPPSWPGLAEARKAEKPR